MKVYSHYSKDTGQFTGRVLSTNLVGDRLEQFLARRRSKGQYFVEGRFNPQLQRIDVETGKVVGDSSKSVESLPGRERSNRRIAAIMARRDTTTTLPPA